MRRLIVVQLLPALALGGAERTTLETARALVAAGHRSIVISAGGRLVEQLLAEGSEHVRLAIGAKSLRVGMAGLRLRSVLARLRPDIVHARSRLPAWLARFAMQGLDAPKPQFVTSVHGLNSPGRYSRVLVRADAVICVSETVRAHVLQHWPETEPARLEVIAPGIDDDEFPRDYQPTPAWRTGWTARYPALAARVCLLLPGRGSARKGHRQALRLLAALRAQGLEACLWLLGARVSERDGYADALEVEARDLGLAEAVAITPATDDMREAYACADVVLQLSESPEAFGRTVLEALVSGRPVLGWRHGGVGELLDALYPAGAVSPFDVEALADRARHALQAPAPVPPIAGYSLADAQRRTLEIYERLGGG